MLSLLRPMIARSPSFCPRNISRLWPSSGTNVEGTGYVVSRREFGSTVYPGRLPSGPRSIPPAFAGVAKPLVLARGLPPGGSG
jgi:hypothetical protein